MRKLLIAILINLILFSCHDQPTANLVTNGHITIIDSTDKAASFIHDRNNPGEAYYPVYLIGEQTDTFRLGLSPISMSSDSYLDDTHQQINNWTFPDASKMRIYVDTALNVTHRAVYYRAPEEFAYEKMIDSVAYYPAFPVFIYNQSDSTFSVGSHNAVGYLVREAKDERGKWIPVERPIDYFCGTSKRELILEPNKVLVAKLLRYEGDFKTECRLKFSR